MSFSDEDVASQLSVFGDSRGDSPRMKTRSASKKNGGTVGFGHVVGIDNQLERIKEWKRIKAQHGPVKVIMKDGKLL